MTRIRSRQLEFESRQGFLISTAPCGPHIFLFGGTRSTFPQVKGGRYMTLCPTSRGTEVTISWSYIPAPLDAQSLINHISFFSRIFFVFFVCLFKLSSFSILSLLSFVIFSIISSLSFFVFLFPLFIFLLTLLISFPFYLFYFMLHL